MMAQPDTIGTAPAEDRLRAYLARAGYAQSAPRVVPLTGDASDRQYFRVIRADGPPIVLAVHAGPFDYDTLTYANTARLLQEMQVPIPAMLGHADDLGILEIEDLGDVTLQGYLSHAAAPSRAVLYREAIDIIVRIQQRGAELASAAYVPYGVAFDVEKLTWELDFFVTHFIEEHRGVRIALATRAALRNECAPIVEELAGEPRVLCHRDYHSRNLMVHRDRLYVIDFQDARMGPNTYDLVSLLRDSYVDVGDELVAELTAYFLSLTENGATASDFRRRFDLMALQRNLKALGTFGYQTTTRHNPVYRQYIPRTLRHVRDNLVRNSRFDKLRDLLACLLEELR